MDIFDEFKSLKKTYQDLVGNRFSDAPFSESFECIYDVIEYIYDCEENGEEVSDDLYDLFAFGYRYLNEKFLYINSLLDKVYKNDNNLKKHYEDLDALFYTMDFITDAKFEDLDSKELEKIEIDILDKIENNKPLDKDIIKKIDEEANKVFKKGFHGFMETFEVLYDAITYGIEDSEKDDGEFYNIDK